MSPVWAFVLIAWAVVLLWAAATATGPDHGAPRGRAAYRVLLACLAVAVVAAMWGLTAALVQEAR